MPWIPTGDRVLIRFDEIAERVSPMGIVLPGRDTEERHREATIASVGKDVEDLAVGDRVLLSAYAGTTVEDDELSRIVVEGEIMAVIVGGK